MKYNIRLFPKKSFLGYPSVLFLGQYINAFGLITAAEKFKVIIRFDNYLR